MEDTYALLSKLVQTKSIEKVLAPIASQVSQLIIINEAYEGGDTEAFPADLVPSASLVQASTDGLVEVASRLSTDSPDEELRAAMPRATELLTVSGASLVTATQRVQIDNFSRDARRHLVRSAKDVLQATLKVLLVTDDAEIRKINKSISWTRECLGALTAVRVMKKLVPAFKSFTESLILLTSLVDKRQSDISHPQQREAVLNSLSILKKCVPMLNSALQTYIKYPQNTQAKASKLYVVGQVLECLEELEDAIHSKDLISDEFDEPETPGFFVTSVDKAVELLSPPQRLIMSEMGTDLDHTLEGVVRHAMEVSQTADEHHRSLIVRNARRLLKQRTDLCDLAHNVRAYALTTPGLRDDFDDASERLLEEIRDIERHVHGAVLHLVVDVFKETTEPLDRMVKAALANHEVPEGVNHVGVDAFIELFHQHSDKMMMVAKMTAATSLDAKKVRTILTCISHMSRLDPELGPATLACHGITASPQSPTRGGTDSADTSGAASLEHLRLLKREWAAAVDVLVQTIDLLVDGGMFVEVSESEIRSDVSKCKQSMYSEEAAIAEVTRSLIGRARRVSQRAEKTVSDHLDALYRNGVMAYISQLNRVIPAVKASANAIMADLGNPDLHHTYHRRCDVLVRHVRQIKEALLGNVLPDLLDPIRDNVRSSGGLGALDLGDSYDDRDQEKKASPVKTPSKKKVQEVVAERKAIKSYISDVVRGQIEDLIKAITTAAIAGQHQKLSVLGNSVLATSNHVTDVADVVAKHCPQEAKILLREASSQLVQLTPQLLEKSRQVADCDTYQLDPLHEVAREWADTVTSVESSLDSQLQRWRSVPDKLVDAANMANTDLLQAQKKFFQEHSSHLSDLVNTALGLVDQMDVVAREKVVLLSSRAAQFKNLTESLLTMAELGASEADSDRARLPHTSRAWAAHVYSLTATMTGLSCQAVHALYGRTLRGYTAPGPDDNDVSYGPEVVSDVRGETVRLKADIEACLNGCKDTFRENEGHTSQKDLDELCARLEDCSTRLNNNDAPFYRAEIIYAPYAMSLALWQWATKVYTVRAMLDRWTAEYCEKMVSFVDDVRNLHRATSEDSRQTSEVKCRRFVTYQREAFHKTRSKVLDILQNADDLDQKSDTRRHLETMSEVTDEVERAAKDMIAKFDPDQLLRFEAARRRWGIRCLELTEALKGLTGPSDRAVTDAIQSMKLKEPRSPAGGYHSNSYQGNKTYSSIGNTGKSGNNSGPAPSGLTGSLGDFADDLLEGSAYDDDDTLKRYRQENSLDLVDSTLNLSHFRHEGSTEEQTACIWLGDESMSEIRGILKLPKPASSTATGVVKRSVSFESTTPRSFTENKTYQHLSTGPRTQHTTPERATPGRGGYRAGTPGRGAWAGGQASASLFPFGVEADKWEEDNNTIVRVARDVAQQLRHMTEYTRGEGPISSKEDLIKTAKSVAQCGEKLVKFARVLVAHCLDQRVADELQSSADRMPTVMAQLHILASVKAAAPDDRSTEKMLVKTSQNLMDAINRMLRNAEAACVKGLRHDADADLDDTAALVLATQWRRRFHRHRLLEHSTTSVDEYGLRKVSQQGAAPGLSQILMGQ